MYKLVKFVAGSEACYWSSKIDH